MRPVLLPISYLLVLSTNRFLSNRDKDQQREHGSKWDRKGNLEKFCIEGETWRTLNFCVLLHTLCQKTIFGIKIHIDQISKSNFTVVKTDFTLAKIEITAIKIYFTVVKTVFIIVKTFFHTS